MGRLTSLHYYAVWDSVKDDCVIDDKLIVAFSNPGFRLDFVNEYHAKIISQEDAKKLMRHSKYDYGVGCYLNTKDFHKKKERMDNANIIAGKLNIRGVPKKSVVLR